MGARERRQRLVRGRDGRADRAGARPNLTVLADALAATVELGGDRAVAANVLRHGARLRLPAIRIAPSAHMQAQIDAHAEDGRLHS